MGQTNKASILIEAVDQTKTAFDSAGHNVEGLEKSIGSMREMASRAVELYGLAKTFEAINHAAEEAEIASDKLEAVLRATEHSAGISKKTLDEYADALSKSTQFDDESLRNAESELLKFGNIQGKVFTEALKLSADVAAFMGEDVPSAAARLGKSLVDPETAFGLLKRAGVALTEQQKDQIKTFEEMGQKSKAQELILKQLERAFGGTAETLNHGYTKATHDASKAWEEFLESMGKTKTYQSGVENFFGFLTGALVKMKSLAEQGDEAAKKFNSYHPGMRISDQQNVSDRTSSGKIGGRSPSANEEQLGVVNERLRQLEDAEYQQRKKRCTDAGGKWENGRCDMATDENLKKGLEGQLKVYEGFIESEKNLLSQRQTILDAYYKDDVVNIADYYAAKRAIINENLSKTLASYQKEIDALEAFKGRAKKESEKTEATTKQTELHQKMARSEQEANTQIVQGVHDESKAYQDLTRSLNALEVEYARMQGRLGDSAALSFDLQNDQLRKKLTAQASDPATAEQAAAGLKKLEELRARTIEDNATDWESGAKRALRNYVEDIANVAKSTEQLFTKAFQGMEDALVNFVKTGKLDFKSMADSIITDLIRIQIRQSVLGPIAGGIKEGGFAGGLLAIGGMLGFATGGDPPVGVPYMVGEKGPEVRIDRTPGTIIPNHALGGTTNYNVSVSVDASGSKVQGDSGTAQQLGQRIESAVRQVLIKEQRPGGMLSPA